MGGAPALPRAVSQLTGADRAQPDDVQERKPRWRISVPTLPLVIATISAPP